MTLVNSKITKLLERYESGYATEREKELVEEWYAIHSHKAGKELSDAEKDRIYQEIDASIQSRFPAPNVKLHTVRRLLKVAALLLVMLSFSLITYRYRNEMLEREVTWETTVTPLGQTKEIVLPDQSVIFLNAGSELSVPSNFGDKQREVILKGEAFFKIQKDSTRRFTIRSGKIHTSVLGTSFNIKAYTEDRHAEIAVESGRVKVELEKANGQLISLVSSMVRNQHLVLDIRLNRYVLKAGNTQEISSWRTNSIYFDNASLEEMVAVLTRMYNVPISLAGIETGRRYTLHFNNQPLKKVLTVICSLSDADYKIKDDTVILTRK